MAKVAAAATSTNFGTVAGKRLGIKKYAGENVKAGNIIVRQNGTVYHPGNNTYMSKNYSIHAKLDGVVKFRRMSGFKRGKFYIDVVESK
ncbi:MAG: 50S ribosomal protein L27 [Candidatus Dojkabacteria bacterium]|jgi:large subunit ribosomal protein L27|nr:50S ribosomal protein L27 [Candidatus Dojkabacteria bacterium]MDD4561148.1 50S ribosomal protein L27 [Candidatus Dojkabacteria bacterium]NLB11973.1 50S ribosomal protein L27 [Candidatus Dojkabacteria bacterium]